MKNFQNNAFFNAWKDMPGMNFGKITEIQKKNAEVFSKVGQTALEASQSIMHRQAEMAKSMTNNALNVVKMNPSAHPSEVAGQQAKAMKQNIENFSSDIQEMSEMVYKSASEIFNTLSQRATECVEEWTEMFNQSNKARV